MLQSIAATEIAHQVRSLVDFGHDQLIIQQNARQALVYATEARARLEDELQKLKGPPEFQRALKGLWPSIWTLHGNCGVMLGDMSAIRESADGLLGADCDCRQGYFFGGIADLNASMEAVESGPTLLQKSIDSLGKSIPKDQPGHPASLLLAVAYLEARQPAKAIDHSQRYLDAFPDPERRRQTPVDRGRVFTADNIVWLSKIYAREVSPRARHTYNHDDKAAYLPVTEARLIENVIRRLTKDRYRIGLPEEIVDDFGGSCLRAIVQIRRAGCCGEELDELEQLANQYGIPKSSALGYDFDEAPQGDAAPRAPAQTFEQPQEEAPTDSPQPSA